MNKFIDYIKNNNYRFLLFLFGCITSRLALAYIIKSYTNNYYMQLLLTIIVATIGFGFITIFLTGIRKTGLETGGKPIWWNILRPFHGLAYLISAWLLFNGGSYNKNMSGNILIIDTIIGLIMWIIYHTKELLSI